MNSPLDFHPVKKAAVTVQKLGKRLHRQVGQRGERGFFRRQHLEF